MTNRTFKALLLLSCWVALAPAAADEGRTPIWQQTAITEPGSYVVTRNITAAGTVIDVQATGVTIDLNGFVIESTDPAVPVIRLRPSAADSGAPHAVRFHNGEVHGGFGFDVEGISNLKIEQMIVASNVPSTTKEGLLAANIKEVHLKDSEFQGFYVKMLGGSEPITGTVENVNVSDAAGNCFEVSMAEGVAFKEVHSHGCGFNGLNITDCDGCIVKGFRGTGADVHALFVDFSRGMFLDEVDVNGSTSDNVVIGPLADGTVIVNLNSTDSTTGWGLRNLGSTTRCDGCNLTSNAAGGIINEGSSFTATESASRNNGGPNFSDLGVLTYQAQNCFD